MIPFTIIRHSIGSKCLRYLGLGPRFIPCKGIKQIQKLLDENTTWGQKRTVNDIKIMLKHSHPVISLWRDQKIIGFGRATTDQIFRATLWDVVIKKEEQGNGLGKIIIKHLLATKQLKNVERVYLMTTDSCSFYEQVGFTKVKDQKLMIKKLSDY